MNQTRNIRAAVVTVSDTRQESDDLSGTTLIGLLLGNGIEVIERTIIRDEIEQIKNVLIKLSADEKINLIFTAGGTGLAARDVTPEATLAVIEKQIPGLAEFMRAESFKITPKAVLSRAVCGVRGQCLIINLPGSPKAVKECFEIVKPFLKHCVDLLRGDTSHLEN